MNAASEQNVAETPKDEVENTVAENTAPESTPEPTEEPAEETEGDKAA